MVVLTLPASSVGQDVIFVTPTQYTQNDGLTSYYPTKIIKDTYGFMWIGTQEGLNLFDGSRFQTFTKRSPQKHRINGSFVSDLVEDKKRNWIWVLLSYGEVCAIDLQTRTVTRRVSLDTSNPDNVKWKRCLAIRGDTLWIAGHDFAAAYHIEEKKFLPIDIKTNSHVGKDELNIAMIFFDHLNRMVIFADGYGVIVLDKNFNHLQTFTKSTLQNRNANAKLRFWDAVMMKNKLYVGSTWALQIFDVGSREIKRLAVPDSPITQSEILSITASPDTTLLFSSHRGIYELDLRTYNIISFKDVYPDNNLFTSTYDIFYDPATQRAWLATSSGIASFPTRIKYFRPFSRSDNKTKIQHLFSVLPISENIIYAGDENGIYYVDVSTNEITKIDNTGSNLMLFKDLNNNVFVSNKSGLKLIEGKRLRPARSVFPSLSPLDADHLSCGIQYNDSLVIFGSIIQKGLNVWNTTTGKLKVYNQYSATHSIDGLTIINYLYKTKSGDVMILTEKSVISFNPLTGHYTTYNIRDITTNEILSNFMDMCEVKDRFYIATYGDGLIETDNQFNVIRIIRNEEGLNNACIYRVFSYKEKSIIATTNNGLSLITLDPFKIKNYFQTDGLHSNGFEQLCGFQDDHRIIAGGVDGFTIIDPASLPKNPRAPDIYFTNLSVKTSSGMIDTCHITMQEMTIPTDALQTTITFSGLNYTNPEAVNYAYKIRELNGNWIDLGTQDFVDLIGLSHGQYTFEVRSSNEDGIWNETPLALKLTYLPKWYQTNFFKISIIVLCMLMIYGLLRYRIGQIHEQQKIRKDIGNDLHDDIGSTLNTLKIFTHLAIRDPGNKSHLIQIEESITQATMGLRDMIWVLEDSEDSIYELMERIKKFALPVCVANGIKFNADIESDNSSKQLLKTEKRNLLLIAKEAINNSIKYSRCQNIYVSVVQARNELKFRIADDGVGFDSETITYGKGLKSIKYRAQQIFFDLEIRTTPSKGTSIDLGRRRKQINFKINGPMLNHG